MLNLVAQVRVHASTPTVSVQAGDLVTATWTSLENANATLSLEVPENTVVATSTAQSATGSVSYLFLTDATDVKIRSTASTDPTQDGDVQWSCSYVGLPAAPIPNWVQAYGRSSEDEDCPAGYNPAWAGGPGADLVGYAKSWQQWMNDGQGGWVCTRSIPSLG